MLLCIPGSSRNRTALPPRMGYMDEKVLFHAEGTPRLFHIVRRWMSDRFCRTYRVLQCGLPQGF